MFLDSSKDILYLVLAFSILWFTAFLCWALYYVVKIMRDTSDLIEDVKDKLDMLCNAIDGMKDRMAKSVSALGTMATGAKFAMGLFEKHAEKVVKKAKKSAKKTADKVKKKARKVRKDLEEDDYEE